MQEEKERIIELNEEIIEKQSDDKRIRMLIVDKRSLNLGGKKRKEDRIILELEEEIKAKYGYSQEDFYLVTAANYDSAIEAASEDIFDFILLYKLIDNDKKNDASGLIKKLNHLTEMWSSSPFYFVAYRCAEKEDEGVKHLADTNFNRYSTLNKKSECNSGIEEAIFNCKNLQNEGIKKVVFVGELESGTMRLLMNEFYQKREEYNASRYVFENGMLLEWQNKMKVLNVFKKIV